jgi:PKD repeat protein
LNNCVSSATTEVVEIMNPIADFSRLISFLTIQFTDSSQHATGWLWDFGDGTTSNQQNPAHIFPWPGGTFTVTLTVWNECDTVSISEEFTVNDEHNSVNELNDANSWKVYPNPTVDQINVMPLSKTQGETIISLYDLRGQLVTQRKMGEVISGQAIVLDVSNLAQGMYVLHLQNDISNQTHNVIVK